MPEGIPRQFPDLDMATVQPDGPITSRPLADVVSEVRGNRHDRFRKWIALASIGLVFLGLAAVVVGLIGDGRDWWEARPFLTNLLSTISGACFGIPVAIVVLRRAEELRHREDAANRDTSESVAICERMNANAGRIERYWVDMPPNADGRDGDNGGWASLVTDVVRLTDLVRQTGADVSSELTAAIRPLTVRFRMVGMGGVHVAISEIAQDWARLRQIASSSTYLREWENEWASTRIIDVRTFTDILRAFDERGSHEWCDFFARMPDPAAPNEAVLTQVGQNAHRALRFLYETGTVLARLRGPRNLAQYWLSALAAYNDAQASQYDSAQMRDDRARPVDQLR
jgi:hypothetical protein